MVVDIRGIVARLAAWCLCTCISVAQYDDYEGQWLAPTLDALERFREDPVCLRCATPNTLIQVPGISKRTASRIIAACGTDTITSIEHLAEVICASPEQFLMLHACTTLSCTCFTLVRSLRARIRTRHAESSTYTARIDATHAYGTAGMVALAASAAPLLSGWLTAAFNDVEVSGGDIAFLSGTGLLLGTGRTLLRRGVDVLPPSTPMIATRPWPSTAFDVAPRGVSAQWRSSAMPIAAGATAWIDRTTPSSQIHSAIHLSARIADLDVQTSLVRSYVNAMPSEALSTTLGYDSGALRVVGELRTSMSAIEGMHVVAGYSADRLDVVGALWTYSPTVEIALGSSVLGGSQPRNERGLHIALHQRLSWQVSVAGSLTMSERLSRTYLDPLPPHLTDLRCDIEARPTRTTHLRLRASHRQSSESIGTPDGRQMITQTTQHMRLDYEHPLTRRLLLRARFELRNADTHRDSSDLSTLISVMCRVQATQSLTISAQVAQWRAASYDVAPRIGTLGVPGTFDLLVCTGIGAAFHMQARWELPWNFVVHAHLRHEIRGPQTTTQWTLQSEWRLTRANE